MKKHVLLEKSRKKFEILLQNLIYPIASLTKIYIWLYRCTLIRDPIFEKKNCRKHFFFSKYSVLKKISSVWIYKIKACHIWSYRVSHFEMSESKWFWGIEGSIILLIFLWRHVQQHCTFEFHQSIFTLMAKLVLHSLRSEGCQNWTWNSTILPQKNYVFKTSK